MAMFNPLSNAFGLDLGDRTFKAVQVSGSGDKRGFKLKAWGSIAVDEGAMDRGEILDIAKCAGFVKQLITKTHGKIHGRAVVASLPEAKSFVKVIEGTRTRVPSGSPVLVDDAHLLSDRQRRALLRRTASFVLTTHRDLEDDVLAAGFESVVVRPAEYLSAERLHVAFARRIEAVRRGPGPVPRLERATVGRLLARFHDDVRSMEHELYEAFSRLRGCTDVQL